MLPSPGGTGCGRAPQPTPTTRRNSPGADDARRGCEGVAGARAVGHGRGSGRCLATSSGEHGRQLCLIPRGRRSTRSARSTRASHRATTTSHLGHRSAAMIGWYGTAMLCYVTPGTPGPAGSEGRRDGVVSLQDRGCARTSPRGPISARAWDAMRCQERGYRVPLGRPVHLALDPETAREFHDRRSRPRALAGALLQHVRPTHFCSISPREVRGTPRRGRRREKRRARPRQESEEFVGQGAEIYKKSLSSVRHSRDVLP
jgi:hypothetical protein